MPWDTMWASSNIGGSKATQRENGTRIPANQSQESILQEETGARVPANQSQESILQEKASNAFWKAKAKSTYPQNLKTNRGVSQ